MPDMTEDREPKAHLSLEGFAFDERPSPGQMLELASKGATGATAGLSDSQESEPNSLRRLQQGVAVAYRASECAKRCRIGRVLELSWLEPLAMLHVYLDATVRRLRVTWAPDFWAL